MMKMIYVKIAKKDIFWQNQIMKDIAKSKLKNHIIIYMILTWNFIKNVKIQIQIAMNVYMKTQK